MPTLMETMRTWADGYNTLYGRGRHADPVDPALSAAVSSLRRHASLADLAGAYWSGDHVRRIAEEHHPNADLSGDIRNAAYWLRFMEIRHRNTRAS